VQKFFRTRENYDRDGVLSMLTGSAESPLVFSLDHGNGNRWRVERRAISSKEILQASSRGRGVNPVIFSIACINAAFDESTVKEEIFSSSEGGDVSVGVALLQSVSGAVAYFGAARNAVGSPIYEIDDRGNLELSGSTYTLKLLESAAHAYHDKEEGRLGDFTLEAFRKYAADPGASISKDRSKWSFFNTNLLGDPVMRFPKRAHKDVSYPLAQALTEIEAGFAGILPTFDLSSALPSSLEFESTAPVEVTLYEQRMLGVLASETQVKSELFSEGKNSWKWEPSEDPINYFLRIENQAGLPVERQVWFRTH
jgi:hypothetical protein